jgi:6-phosphofructokinase 1
MKFFKKGGDKYSVKEEYMPEPLQIVRSRIIPPAMQRMLDTKAKVAIVHGGGPAPGSNAVIEMVTLSFLNIGVPVVGIYDGFEWLEKIPPQQFVANKNPIFSDCPYYIDLKSADVAGIRFEGGASIQTSRANPGGKEIERLDDFNDPIKTRKLLNVLAVLNEMNVRMLITIGGDDTLKTAYFLSSLAALTGQHLAIVQAAKTIDRDYPEERFSYAIPTTFGFSTASQIGGEILRSLWRDAKTTSAYFIVRLMGRSAGWLTAATAMYGKACMALIPEEVEGVFDVDAAARSIARSILRREKEWKRYGVIAVSEGLATKLPDELKPKKEDSHGNPNLGAAGIEQMLAEKAWAAYQELRRERGLPPAEKKIVPKDVGYEVRSANPNSFDVTLGLQFGNGAFKLLSQGISNVLVTVDGNFRIGSIPFAEMTGDKLKIRKREVGLQEDFYQLLLATQDPSCVESRRDDLIQYEGGGR